MALIEGTAELFYMAAAKLYAMVYITRGVLLKDKTKYKLVMRNYSFFVDLNQCSKQPTVWRATKRIAASLKPCYGGAMYLWLFCDC